MAGQPALRFERRSVVRILRVAVLIAALLSVGLPGTARADTIAAAETATLPCRDVIDTAGPPWPGWTKVFGKVWLPQARRTLGANIADLPEGDWYWIKQGLGMKAGSKFTLTVPDEWRGHLAIGWGSPAKPSEQVTVDGCRYSTAKWLAYAGGYWIDKRACVPLIVDSAGRRKMVRIPLGKPCPVSHAQTSN
jgi:hypothetical protein